MVIVCGQIVPFMMTNVAGLELGVQAPAGLVAFVLVPPHDNAAAIPIAATPANAIVVSVRMVSLSPPAGHLRF
jgi:hypothetical protein